MYYHYRSQTYYEARKRHHDLSLKVHNIDIDVQVYTELSGYVYDIQ